MLRDDADVGVVLLEEAIARLSSTGTSADASSDGGPAFEARSLGALGRDFRRDPPSTP